MDVTLINDIIELDDLVYSYIDINNPDIQYEIARKQEFNELKPTNSDPTPLRGNFYPHQKFIHRLLEISERIIIFSRTGTGKTGTAVGAAENYKNGYYKDNNIGTIMSSVTNYFNFKKSTIKKVYILVRGSQLSEQYKKSIIYKYSKPEDYEKKIDAYIKKNFEIKEGTIIYKISRQKNKVIKSLTPEEKVNRYKNKLLREFYIIKTYGQFASKYMGKEWTEDNIKKEFSNTMFILDEIHNIKSGDIAERERAPEYVKPSTIEQTDVKQRKQTIRHFEIYNVLKKIFDNSKGIRILLMTATPMGDKVSDLYNLINLIIKDFPYKPSDIENLTIDQLEQFLRGKLSFIREMSNELIIEYPGDNDLTNINTNIDLNYNINRKYNIKIYPIFMPNNTIQYTTYNKYLEKENGILYGLGKGAARSHEREVSNIAYADGTFGSEGYKIWIEDTNNNIKLRENMKKNLIDLSIKFYTILKIEENSIGKFFCFSNFNAASGAIPLHEAFLANGYHNYDGVQSPFVTISAEILETLSFSKMGKNMKRRINMSITKRCAILRSNMSSIQFDNIISLYNSPENVNGDYIKGIIVPPVGREGIDLFDVLRAHIVDIAWTEPENYQAISRILRSGGHDSLIKQRKEQYQKGEITDQTIIVSIYNYVAIPSDLNKKQTIEFTRLNINNNLIGDWKQIALDQRNKYINYSIDYEMYYRTRKKDIPVKGEIRNMKKITIDCYNNRLRNILSENYDYNIECDYELCNYTCYPKSFEVNKNDILYDSFNVLYSYELINKLLKSLLSLFEKSTYIDIYDIYRTNTNIKPMYVQYTLEYIIKNKISIINRYGYKSYLYEKGTAYYLKNKYPLDTIKIETNRGDMLYQDIILKSINRKMTDTIRYYGIDNSISTSISVDNSINNSIKLLFDSLSPNEEVDPNKFELIIKKLHPIQIGPLIEYSISQKILEKETILTKYIYNYYSIYIHEILEPIGEFKKFAEENVEGTGKQGRKRKWYNIAKVSKPSIKKLENYKNIYPRNPNGPTKVYIHDYYTAVYIRNISLIGEQYSEYLRYKRILVPDRSKLWRDTANYEIVVYDIIFQIKYYNKCENMQFIYGLKGEISKIDGKFRIIDKLSEIDTEKPEKTGKTLKTGKICDTWKIKNMFSVLYRLDIYILQNLIKEKPYDQLDKEEKESYVKFISDERTDKKNYIKINIEDFKVPDAIYSIFPGFNKNIISDNYINYVFLYVKYTHKAPSKKDLCAIIYNKMSYITDKTGLNILDKNSY